MQKENYGEVILLFLAYIRTLLLYSALIIVIRLMGKRQIGEMEPSEFVVAMLIADLASVPMQDSGIPLLSGLIPIFTVLALELILSSLSFRYVGFRRLLCGKPVILMENGKILYDNLKKTRVSVNELVEHLRESGTVDLTTVKFAVLETNGKISALLFPKYEPAPAKDAGIKVNELELPVTLICDGKWQEENLLLSGKTKTWASGQLQSHNCPMEQVLLFTVTPSGKTYLARKEA